MKVIAGLFAGLLLFLSWDLKAQCDDDDDLPGGSIDIGDIPCGGGSVTLTFTFTDDDDDDQFDVQYRIGGTTFNLSNVLNGHTVNHTIAASTTVTLVSITDEDGCSASINESTPVTVPAAPVLSLSTISSGCTGNTGRITATTTGGSGPFQYSSNGGPFQSSGVFNNLAPGSYSVTVRSSNDCEDTETVNVGSTNPPSLSLNSSNPACGASNGSISASASGGSGALQYRLNAGTFQSSGTFSNLAAGTYTVTVRDAAGCEDSDQVTLTGGAAPNLSTSSANPACGASNGSISASAGGGSGGLQYRLNAGTFQSSGTFSNLAAGTYTLTVRDAAGCEDSEQVVLSNPNAPTLTIASQSQPDCNSNNGGITLQANGGTSPFQYRQNTGSLQAAAVFSNLAPGTYNFTVRDANNCEATISATFNNATQGLTQAQITGSSTGLNLCLGQSLNLSANLPSGTLGTWSSVVGVRFASPNSPTSSISVDAPGNYTLTWTLSAPNCRNYSQASIAIRVAARPKANDDELNIKASENQNLEILKNDDAGSNFRLSVLSNPKQGQVFVNNDNTIRYTPNAGANGSDQFTYTLCQNQCVQVCDTALVKVKFVDDNAPCDLEKIDPNTVFPEGITPNGDQYNEFLVFKIVDKIGCPTNYAKSDLSIFNRWGDKVFAQEPYENQWNGMSNSGQELPPGVYYYTLRIRKENGKIYRKFGQVTIFR
jgi:gliding motility-associated-like protein